MSKPASGASAGPKTLRCAIYTRKSSDEGLEQSFNSLHAQREASEAYIKSQAHEGWVVLPTLYDDGGFSGGSMERPALKALLNDIKAKKIDVVVVYKIDRLTRSLMDFSRIVEVFDQAEVSFVSITQAFNTTSSMGRLTLNVLLSFAQFEREVTGERIRDKIAQSKAKGMWMGGLRPLGYDVKDHILIINEAEAEVVRAIFKRYLKLGSVHRLRDELELNGVRSKLWTSSTGKMIGGQIFSRGALYHLLQNRHYLGDIVHRDKNYPSAHAPIVDQTVFERVQELLTAHRRRPFASKYGANDADPDRLKGRLFDAEGDPMSPTHSRGRSGKRYRYYVSSCLQLGVAPASAPSLAPRRLPGPQLEHFVLNELRRLSDRPHATWPELSDMLKRIDLRSTTTDFVLDARLLFAKEHPRLALNALRARLAPGDEVAREPGERHHLRIRLARKLGFRGGERGVMGRAGDTPAFQYSANPALIKALRAGHQLVRTINASHAQGAQRPDPISTHERRLCKLAFLAPDLQLAILRGAQPTLLTLDALLTADMPMDWEGQRRWWRSLG